jgi:hypothetical protein
VELRIEENRIHLTLTRKTRDLKLVPRKAKAASAGSAESGREVKPNESSLNHPHGRSIAQQHATHTAGVKTSFMS